MTGPPCACTKLCTASPNKNMDSAEQAPDSGKKHCVQVSSEQTGQKMLSFLQRLLPDVPASALHRALRRGEVRLNSKRCKPFTRVSYGDEIRIPPFSSRPTQSADTVLPAPIDILHTTPDFFIVHKPAGLPVHGGSGSPDSVITSIRRMFPNESFQSTPVHRLDKHTSGLLLIARSYTFLRHMHCLWQTRKVKKHYLAWVDGNWPDSKEVCLTDELARRSKNGREKIRLVLRAMYPARTGYIIAQNPAGQRPHTPDSGSAQYARFSGYRRYQIRPVPHQRAHVFARPQSGMGDLALYLSARLARTIYGLFSLIRKRNTVPAPASVKNPDLKRGKPDRAAKRHSISLRLNTTGRFIFFSGRKTSTPLNPRLSTL